MMDKFTVASLLALLFAAGVNLGIINGACDQSLGQQVSTNEVIASLADDMVVLYDAVNKLQAPECPPIDQETIDRLTVTADECGQPLLMAHRDGSGLEIWCPEVEVTE